MTRLVFGLIATTTLLGGCGILPGTACNLMFAPSNLGIELDGDSRAAGEWVVELEVDAGTVRCTREMPDDPADRVGPDVVPCDDDGWTEMLIDDDGQLAFIRTMQTDDVVLIRVLHSEVEVASATLEPAYTEDEPNGRGCGVRRTASESLSW